VNHSDRLIDEIWFILRTCQFLYIASLKLGAMNGIIITIILTEDYVEMVHNYL